MKIDYHIDMDENSTWMIVTPGTEAKQHLPFVQELGDFFSREKYYTMRESLPSYLIKYTIGGVGMLEYDGATSLVPPGHFFWIDCTKHQIYKPDPTVGHWHTIWVHFYGMGCAYYYDRFLSANSGKNHGALPSDNTVAEKLYELMRLYQSPTANTDAFAAALLYDIMSQCVRACEQPHEVMPEYVMQIRDYLLSHYTEKVTLDTLARHFSLNKFYLQKLFRQCMEQSPNEFLTNVRIGHSKELLRTTKLSVSDIAIAVGIENPSHYIALFQRTEGLTPGAYRRKWQTTALK